jgi:hypothetical protein
MRAIRINFLLLVRILYTSLRRRFFYHVKTGPKIINLLLLLCFLIY